ncbi:ABC transporter permease [Hyphomicrobium sp.]|uniref:ABC transporter permease n=1 Tax=Hyphomicrobium sp. TaxID=82 RepID=UPI0025C3E1EC|nr:ABC transporter permease [Hyphomicrobium sp.]
MTMDQRTERASDATVAPAAKPTTSLLARLRRRFHLSPVNRRRWERFKAHKIGYRSFIIFTALFVGSLFAEFIANDRPLIASYKGEILFPVLVDYPEEKFGGFLAVTDYRTPDIANEINANGWMLWPPIRYSYSTINKDYPGRIGDNGVCLGYPAPPPWATKLKLCDAPADQVPRYEEFGNTNWLGLDDQGRDVLARVIYGFRISVLFGLILTVVSSAVGILAGAVQGYFGGRVDLIFQRLLEIWNSIPELFVLLIISSLFIPGFWTLLGILMIFSWTSLVGLVRAEFLRGRNLEYVRAARALGLSDWQIMFKHLLPNAAVATLTFLPFKLSGGIAALTALDFLGLGMPPGSPSLGELLLQGKKHLEAPWLGISGFIAVSIILSLAIFMGEAVRDALDPRKTFRGKS